MRMVLGAGAAVWSLPALAPLSPDLSSALGIPTRIQDRSVACLTFDDGPHPRGTPAVLAALEREDVRATFFFVGEQVRRTPSLAAEVVAAGHTVELHGFRHRNQLRLSPAALRRDIRRGADAIVQATGQAPGLYRPPYGIFSAGGLAMIHRSGLQPMLWSRWGRDWRRDATAASIAARVADGLEGGEVLLLHDSDAYSAPGSWKATAAAVPLVLEQLERRGLAAGSIPAPAGPG